MQTFLPESLIHPLPLPLKRAYSNGSEWGLNCYSDNYIDIIWGKDRKSYVWWLRMCCDTELKTSLRWMERKWGGQVLNEATRAPRLVWGLRPCVPETESSVAALGSLPCWPQGHFDEPRQAGVHGSVLLWILFIIYSNSQNTSVPNLEYSSRQNHV